MILSREQLDDLVQYYSNESQENYARAIKAEAEALRQMERAERLEAILRQALSALNIYDDGDGHRLVSMVDGQMLAAFDAYCELWRSTPFDIASTEKMEGGV